ncbi:MAG: HAD-IA family hydrolase [Gallionellaceae bacterium]
MRVKTVLVISGGGFQGLALIKAMHLLPNVRVLLADCYSENVSSYFADAFFQSPLLNDGQAFLDFAFALCERESVEAVFPSTNFELDLLSRHRGSFKERGIDVFVSDRPLLDLAQDKKQFHAWLINEGLPSLPCFDSPLDQGAGFPLFGKPRGGWGGRGTQVVHDREDYLALADEYKRDYLWQPLLMGFDEYSVDFSINAQSDISSLAIRRRIRALGGFAILCEPSTHARVGEVAADTIRRLPLLGARGIMNLQILVTQDGCWVSDLNPRVGTSMPLSLINGDNPVAFLLGACADEATKPSPPKRPCFRALRTLEERCIPNLDLDSVRAVVLDLDDTLLDQKDWILRKLIMTWERERALLPEKKRFLGMALRIVEEGNRSRLFDALCEELNLGESDRSRLIGTYRSVQPDGCRLYHDVLPCLTQLRRLGYGLGLITDNPPASQREKLEKSGLAGYFDAILLTGELEMTKPDRDAFQEMARRLNQEPDDIVMVGDNLFRDIQGALDFGFKHAFHIQRTGSFFNFSHELATEVMPLDRCTAVNTLRELLWHLRGPQSQ